MNQPKITPKWLSVVFSVILPGLGQIFQRRFRAGIYILIAFATSAAIVIWYGNFSGGGITSWLVIPVLIWLWNIFNVAFFPKVSSVIIPLVLWLILAYGVGGQVTEFDIPALFANAGRSQTMINEMFNLDFTQPRTEKRTGFSTIESPCSSEPPAPRRTTGDVEVTIVQPCSNVGGVITIIGTGFWPNQAVEFAWKNPIGGQAMNASATADATGKVELNWQVLPIVHSTAPDPSVPQIHRIELIQQRPIGGIELSATGGYILQGMSETLGLAFLSTIVGALLAIPLGFLAARNLMTGSPFGTVVYLVVRTLLNITRSIEALILAIIFVIIVGLGPFPGMIALTVHTTAALGKLYSEVIEGIDPGPIEAIRATGANWIQMVRYSVIPQVVPSFTALTIYRWDINVRSSTIIGFVGGGGIGFFLWQWIILQDFRAVGSSFVAIAVVVIILDFVSARIRERLV
jgi:phosphonate transport system permease protein